jgi:hypothetical protein
VGRFVFRQQKLLPVPVTIKAIVQAGEVIKKTSEVFLELI